MKSKGPVPGAHWGNGISVARSANGDVVDYGLTCEDVNGSISCGEKYTAAAAGRGHSPSSANVLPEKSPELINELKSKLHIHECNQQQQQAVDDDGGSNRYDTPQDYTYAFQFFSGEKQ
jgi:hypothetical protein